MVKILGSRRTGNYAYACTRVRAKKKNLIPEAEYTRLARLELDGVSRYISEREYKNEVDVLAQQYEGVDLLEKALTKNLSATYAKIVGFSKGDLAKVISIYLSKLDIWNLKTIIRGVESGLEPDEIKRELYAGGVLNEKTLDKLVSAENRDAVVGGLRGTEYQKLLENYLAKHKDASIAELENLLDKHYYEALAESMEAKKAKADQMFFVFISEEIDNANLITLLKLKFEGAEDERIIELYISGGKEIKRREFERMAKLNDFASLVSELRNFRLYKDIGAELDSAEEEKSIARVLRACERRMVKKSKRFSYLYPISVLPIIHYVIAKKNEVDNLRIIARGKEWGLSPEVIEGMIIA